MKSNLKVGATASTSKIFTAEDVKEFSKLSSDENPVHLDAEYASKTVFGKRIIHGLLVSSLISATIANKLPGKGSIYLSQSLEFKKPVYIEDKITAGVEITQIKETEKGSFIVTLKTKCINANQDVVISGKAVVMVPKENQFF